MWVEPSHEKETAPGSGVLYRGLSGAGSEKTGASRVLNEKSVVPREARCLLSTRAKF